MWGMPSIYGGRMRPFLSYRSQLPVGFRGWRRQVSWRYYVTSKATSETRLSLPGSDATDTAHSHSEPSRRFPLYLGWDLRHWHGTQPLGTFSAISVRTIPRVGSAPLTRHTATRNLLGDFRYTSGGICATDTAHSHSEPSRRFPSELYLGWDLRHWHGTQPLGTFSAISVRTIPRVGSAPCCERLDYVQLGTWNGNSATVIVDCWYGLQRQERHIPWYSRILDNNFINKTVPYMSTPSDAHLYNLLEKSIKSVGSTNHNKMSLILTLY